MFMDIKTCEEYVLNELENTKNELFLVKKELEEHNIEIKKKYYVVFNKLLGYITNFNLTCNDDGVFEIDTIDFGTKDQAVIFEVINDNHIDLNEFIRIASKNNSNSDEPLLWKEELDNTFLLSNRLHEIVDLLRGRGVIEYEIK